MLVEAEGVLREVFVLRIRVADAGVHVQNVLELQGPLQGPVQLLADAVLLGLPVYVNAGFHGPAVGRPHPEGARIGVAADPPLVDADQIGIALQRPPDPLPEDRHRRDLVFGCDGRMQHIFLIDPDQLLGILCGGNSDHGLSLLPLPKRYRHHYSLYRGTYTSRKRPCPVFPDRAALMMWCETVTFIS